MASNYTISSIERLTDAPSGREAYRVMVTFHVSASLDVSNASGVYVEIPAGGGATAVTTALDAQFALEQAANTAPTALPADLSALVSTGV